MPPNNGARNPSSNFCTTSELADELGDVKLGVIDASWQVADTGRIGAAEFRLAHILGAVYFGIETIADRGSGLPHVLPKAEEFAKEMGTLGLGDGMRFVVYDVMGLFAAARVWWTLRAYGVEDVRILEGGLTKWIHDAVLRRAANGVPSPGCSRRASTKATLLRSSKCAPRWQADRRRWSTPAPPTVSAEKPPNRCRRQG